MDDDESFSAGPSVGGVVELARNLGTLDLGALVCPRSAEISLLPTHTTPFQTSNQPCYLSMPSKH